jgi:hypothetical protein
MMNIIDGGLAGIALHFDVLAKTTIVVMPANLHDVGLQPQKFSTSP